MLAVAGGGFVAGGGANLKHGYWTEILGTLAVECLLLAGLDVVVHRVQQRVGGWEENYLGRAFRFQSIFDEGPFDQESRPAVELTLNMPVVIRHGWEVRAHRGEHGARIILSRDVDEIDGFCSLTIPRHSSVADEGSQRKTSPGAGTCSGRWRLPTSRTPCCRSAGSAADPRAVIARSTSPSTASAS